MWCFWFMPSVVFLVAPCHTTAVVEYPPKSFERQGTSSLLSSRRSPSALQVLPCSQAGMQTWVSHIPGVCPHHWVKSWSEMEGATTMSSTGCTVTLSTPGNKNISGLIIGSIHPKMDFFQFNSIFWHFQIHCDLNIFFSDMPVNQKTKHKKPTTP